MLCIQCNTITINPKFCSKSCSVTFNNKLKPKRLLKGSCLDCSKAISNSRKRCKRCHDKNKNLLNDLPIGLFSSKLGRINHTKVRDHARRVYLQHNTKRECERCGYTKHVEVCHITPVKEFSKDSLFSEVNNIKNLIGLCPNCHWEMDNKRHLL